MTVNSRTLTAAILSTLCALSMSASARADALGAYRSAVLADAPLAYWPLDETAGPTAADIGAGGASGTFTGSVGLAAAPPFGAPANRAVRFDAGGTMTAQVPGTAKAVEFWVRPSQRVQQTFVTFGNPSAGGWAVGLSGSKTSRGQRRRIHLTSGGRVTSARMSLPIGSWSMVSVSWGPGSTVRFTVNGRSVTRFALPSGLPASSPSLGSLVVGPGAGAGGTTIDEVALFGTRPEPATHFAGSALPVLAAAPALSAPDTPKVGQPVSITPGTWSPGTVVTDVWQRCDSIGACQAIPGATGSTYVPTAADAGFTIQLQETAVSATGAIVVYSDATEPIAYADGSQPVGAPVLPPGTDPAVPASETQEAIDAGDVIVVDPAAEALAVSTFDDDDRDGAPTGEDATDAVPSACVVRARSAAKRLKLRRMGRRGRVTVRVDAATGVVTVRAGRGVVRKVRWTLDGAKLRSGRGTAVRLPELTAGAHVLRGKVAPRRGRTALVTLRFAGACS